MRAHTESWNGSTWQEVADLSAVKADLGGAGESSTSAIAFGGRTPPNNPSTTTEEWSGSTTTIKVLTD